MDDDDPRCPECGEPIGQTATYCMHCSADLTQERGSEPGRSETSTPPGDASPSDETDGRLLDPEGIVDDSLTAVVGVVGGIIIGLIGTVLMVAATGSLWAVAFGVVAWLGATAYLVRRRTVQGAVSRSAYGLSLILFLVPLVAFSPLMDGGLVERSGSLVALLLTIAIPAGFFAAIGWVASRFIPEETNDPG